MLWKLAKTTAGAGEQATILTSLSQVPSSPRSSACAFTDVGCTELARISVIKIKKSIRNLTVLPLKRRQVRALFLSVNVDADIVMEHSPYLLGGCCYSFIDSAAATIGSTAWT